MGISHRKLGSSHLSVPIVGIGCNAFGIADRRRPGRRPSSTRPSSTAPRSSTPPTPTDSAPARSCSAGRSGQARDDVVIATKFGMDMQGAQRRRLAARRGVGRYVRTLRRGQPAPPRHRPHRPLPAAPARPRQTPIEETLEALDELVDGRARSGPSAARTSRPGSSSTRHWTSRTRGLALVRHRAERVLALQPHGRGGADAGLPRARRRHPAVLPARLRAAHRQVPPRRGGARRARGSALSSQATAPGQRRLGPDRGAGGVRRAARRLDAGARHRRTGRPAGGRQRHRRRDPPRAGRGQRAGGGMGALGGRPGRAGRDRPARAVVHDRTPTDVGRSIASGREAPHGAMAARSG